MADLFSVFSLYYFLVMAKDWNVEREPSIDPPIQAEYLLCQSNTKSMLSYSDSNYKASLCSRPLIMEVPPQTTTFFLI